MKEFRTILNMIPLLVIKPNIVGYHSLTVLAKCATEIDNQSPLMTDIYIKFT